MFERVAYARLNSRQKENYNFQKVAGRLAEYGFNCIRLSDDWNGADFIACHIDGETFLKVQLKGRFGFDGKYAGKQIHVAFLNGDDCYVYPHDEVLEQVLERDIINTSKSWTGAKSYTWPYLPGWAAELLTPYKV